MGVEGDEFGAAKLGEGLAFSGPMKPEGFVVVDGMVAEELGEGEGVEPAVGKGGRDDFLKLLAKPMGDVGRGKADVWDLHGLGWTGVYFFKPNFFGSGCKETEAKRKSDKSVGGNYRPTIFPFFFLGDNGDKGGAWRLFLSKIERPPNNRRCRRGRKDNESCNFAASAGQFPGRRAQI